MNILAFDTCFNACSVAVCRDAGGSMEQLEAYFEPRDVGHAEVLMPMVRRAMSAARMSFSDIDRIAVTNGPGSFTGTRIGVSAARALALATGRPVVAASSLAVMAEDAIDQIGVDPATGRRDSSRPPIAVTVDVRRGQVYAQLFGASGVDARTPPQVLEVAAAVGLGGAGAIQFVGSGAAAVAQEARALGREASAHLPQLQPDACSLIGLAVALPVLEAPVQPLYLREADAKPPADPAIARL